MPKNGGDDLFRIHVQEYIVILPSVREVYPVVYGHQYCWLYYVTSVVFQELQGVVAEGGSPKIHKS